MHTYPSSRYNLTVPEPPDFLHCRTIVDLLRRRALNQPDGEAYTFLISGESLSQSLTYRELDRRARVIAASLQRMGATGEVMILCPAGLDHIAAFFGCAYAGCTAVPVYAPRLE